ncbi:MAG: DUF2642 domain-containing protein [Bacillota bacterium]|nr:DUF2642 domain-containing protein [Bacillota bacterium]
MTVKDPIFVQHMRELVNSRVEVTTTCCTLAGTLADVFPDHLLVLTPSPHHVRIEEICFVRELRKKKLFSSTGEGDSEEPVTQ